MGLIKSSTFTLYLSFLVISVFSQEPPVDLGKVIVPYQTTNVPPNNGTWRICGKTLTDYVSFSVRVAPDSEPITAGFGIETEGLPAGKLPKRPPSGETGKGFVAFTASTTDAANMAKFLPHSFIPSLSCFKRFVGACDQDTGTIPISFDALYCLVVVNLFSNPQKIHAAFSDSATVFENGGFTSPNKDGGNNDTVTKNDTKSSPSLPSSPSSPSNPKNANNSNSKSKTFSSATTISSNLYLMSLCFISIVFYLM